MSEYEELLAKLRNQRERLLAVVIEAEAKVIEYKKALEDGSECLRRIETILGAFGK